MAVTRRTWGRIGIAAAAALVLAPGWKGRLEPTTHEAILAEASLHRSTLGVSVPADSVGAEGAGAEWHVEYLDSGTARMLTHLRLRSAAPSLVAPDFAAHVPAPVGGVQRADAYYRVVASLRWPWWLPGGGMDWERPRP